MSINMQYTDNSGLHQLIANHQIPCLNNASVCNFPPTQMMFTKQTMCFILCHKNTPESPKVYSSMEVPMVALSVLKFVLCVPQIAKSMCKASIIIN